jgi:hypothetical protein
MAALADELHSAVDPVHFAATLGFTPDPWQARVLRWPGKRLLLNCNRQSGKSTTTAIVALHRAMYYPGSLVLLVSPSLRQSGELFRKCSDFLTRRAAVSHRGQPAELHPGQRKQDSITAQHRGHDPGLFGRELDRRRRKR